MISSQPLINKICCALTTGGLTALQCCQAETALVLLCQPVYNVATYANLPDATTYNGRMVYVDSENKYYYAVCNTWSNDFSSTPHGIGSEVWAWGLNTCGPLGDNTTISKNSPVSAVVNFYDWTDVSAGSIFSLGVRQNGTAWSWGCNTQGQLGTNDTTDRSSPVSVVGGFTDWSQISAGCANSLGLRSNGTAWAWGLNDQGQLGDDSTTGEISPVSVIGGVTTWCQISAGGCHSLAIKTDGTVWSWGSGAQGRLGSNSIADRSSPVSVVGGFTDWCQVSGGFCHSLAVRTEGTAWAWGEGASGRLGDNTTTDRSSPVSVVGGFTDWCQVSAGNSHSLGVTQAGVAWAWGLNTNGRLGDDTTVSKNSPVSVVGGFTDWCQVSAGCAHSLGVRQDGTAWAWGLNTNGRLGDNTTVSKNSPVSVVGGFTNWYRVSAGCTHSLGLVSIIVPFQSI